MRSGEQTVVIVTEERAVGPGACPRKKDGGAPRVEGWNTQPRWPSGGTIRCCRSVRPPPENRIHDIGQRSGERFERANPALGRLNEINSGRGPRRGRAFHVVQRDAEHAGPDRQERAAEPLKSAKQPSHAKGRPRSGRQPERAASRPNSRLSMEDRRVWPRPRRAFDEMQGTTSAGRRSQTGFTTGLYTAMESTTTSLRPQRVHPPCARWVPKGAIAAKSARPDGRADGGDRRNPSVGHRDASAASSDASVRTPGTGRTAARGPRASSRHFHLG